jgi:hypothetical protein
MRVWRAKAVPHLNDGRGYRAVGYDGYVRKALNSNQRLLVTNLPSEGFNEYA